MGRKRKRKSKMKLDERVNSEKGMDECNGETEKIGKKRRIEGLGKE